MSLIAQTNLAFRRRRRDGRTTGQAAGEGRRKGRAAYGIPLEFKDLVIPMIPYEKGNSHYDSDTPTHFPSSISVTKKKKRKPKGIF